MIDTKTETRGEKRKRINRERDAARRAGNCERKITRHAAKLQLDGKILGQSEGMIVVKTKTRGEMRKKQKRQEMATLRAEKTQTRKYQEADANIPSHIWMMD